MTWKSFILPHHHRKSLQIPIEALIINSGIKSQQEFKYRRMVLVVTSQEEADAATF